MTFGERLKYFRDKAGLNKSELARKMGVTPAYVRQYEKGTRRNNPKHETIKRFADALDVTPADLAPDRYPVAFESPEEFEAAWLTGGGSHGRDGNLKAISYNMTQLNDDGVREVAEKTDAMVKSGKYRID